MRYLPSAAESAKLAKAKRSPTISIHIISKLKMLRILIQEGGDRDRAGEAPYRKGRIR